MTPTTKAGRALLVEYHDRMHDESCDCPAEFIAAPHPFEAPSGGPSASGVDAPPANPAEPPPAAPAETIL